MIPQSTTKDPLCGKMPWESMQFRPVGDVGELMRTLVAGSRLDNGNASCNSTNRRPGGTRPVC
jgi:hypothetical protein